MTVKLIRRGLLLCISVASLTTFAAYSPSSPHHAKSSPVEDLLDIYWKALNNDPTFKGAAASKRSNEEAISQARANFFPTIAAEGGQSAYRNVKVNTSTAPSQRTTRNSRLYQVSLSQPIFNWSHWMQLGQAKAVVKQADATYDAALQDLMIRTASAYFTVLQAKDTLRFTVAELKANERQLDQAKQRYKVGLDAITSVYDAQASYDTVLANVITARNDVTNAIEALREITGSYDKNLAALKENFPLKPPEPNSPSRWVEQALQKNATLKANTHETEAARYGVKLARANHIPALNVVASYGDNRSSQIGTSLFDTKTTLVNLEVAVPIFQGGSVMSRTRQAYYDYENTQARLDGTQKSVVSTTYQLFNSVINGISTIKADKQAVKSVNSSLESTEAAFKVGTRTIVDVLDRQRDLYDSERKLAADQYQYINDLLALRQSAGTLNERHLEAVNAWLKSRHRLNSMSRFRPGSVSPAVADPGSKANRPVRKVKPDNDGRLYHTQRILKTPYSHTASTTPYRQANKVAISHHVKPIHHQYLAPQTKPSVRVAAKPSATKPTSISQKPVVTTARRVASKPIKNAKRVAVIPKQTSAASQKPASLAVVKSKQAKPKTVVAVQTKQVKQPKLARKPVLPAEPKRVAKENRFELDAPSAQSRVSAAKQVTRAKREVTVVEAQPVSEGELNRPELYQSGVQQQEIHIAKHLEQANVPAEQAARQAKRTVQVARAPSKPIVIRNKPKKGLPAKPVTVRKATVAVRPAANPQSQHQYYLQVAAFKNKDNAKHLVKRLSDAVEESVQVKESHRKNGTTMYSVRVGPIAEANDLYRIQESISSRGFGDPIVQLH